jgi:hypothetical protein
MRFMMMVKSAENGLRALSTELRHGPGTLRIEAPKKQACKYSNLRST